MYKPIILPLAIRDIKEAVVWYNSKQKGLGKQFTKVIRHKVHSICMHPKTGTIRYGNTRTTVLDTFPYMIHYMVDELQNIVIIIGIFHTSLNPDRWKER